MVRLTNLSLAYPNGEKVLKNINLTVKKGEAVLLTGVSGSGKSSIISSINGIATRYDNCTLTGEVTLLEKDTKEMELNEISMLVSSVFQNPKTHFFNVDTTQELLFFLENIGLTRVQMEERMTEMLELFDIKGLLNRSIFELSGGEKQILSIAASYLSGTGLVVLDEPSSNLDETHTEVIGKMLKKMKDGGITLIIAEHRIYYLMDIVDKIYYVKEGEIAESYEIEDFRRLSDEELFKRGIRNRKKERLKVPLLRGEEKGELEVKRLFYRYPKTLKGIDAQNISLQKGKIYGIIGENGIGKSTFIKNLIGVLKNREEVFFEGKKIKKKERLKKAALVMQDVNHQLFTESVEDEVTLEGKETSSERVDEVLRSLGLLSYKKKHPMSLSGGEKQRVAIASVILAEKSLICFDEPTSGMDYANMTEISNLLKRTVNEETILLVISHDMPFLNRTADYVLDIREFLVRDEIE